MTAPAGPVSRASLEQRARWLAYATIAWNSIEAVVAISAGVVAGSVALVGFGLDSVVEVGSAIVIAWQFHGANQEKEALALRLIALSFFGLGAYILLDSGRTLLAGEHPDSSLAGIVVAAASLVVMPLLARAKKRTAIGLGSRTVAADGMQTMLCTYLSAVLLAGLLLNSLLGWWWADPLAAIAIAGIAINEGREAWSGETCEDHCA